MQTLMASSYNIHIVSIKHAKLFFARIKLVALQKLYDLSKLCKASITYHETCIELDGQPDDVTDARSILLNLLEDIRIVQHPTPMSVPLCQSFNKNAKAGNVPAVVVSEAGISYTCCAGAEAERYARKNPSKATVHCAAAEVLLSLSSEIMGIETKHTVNVTMKDANSILVCGYVSVDVKKAKEALIEIVKCKAKVQQTLNCSPPIASYLHYILFTKERSPSTRSFISSLQAELVSLDGQLLLEGTKDTLEVVEKKLMERFVPSELMFEVIEYMCSNRFISQLKQDYLQPLKKAI